MTSDNLFGRAYSGGKEPGPLWPEDSRPRPGWRGITGPDVLVMVLAVAMLVALVAM